ncbi:tRNA-specific 2-thiouridylase [Candidatus Wolfebacteria bacterium]|nr:tRNA-specific 2-thiouridylase [Candidatus Wolfebacteria bacterium]
MLKGLKNKKNKGKVFVAMSGGVDSSVAALLLKKQGYDIIGVFMRCYNLDGCSERDAEDARRVAEKLKIPFYVWDFENAYKKKVVEYMVKGYKKGITPNPDVMCNREIKFGLFLDKAFKMGADYVATGHYVKISSKTGYKFSPAENFSLDSRSDGHRKAMDQAHRSSETFSRKHSEKKLIYKIFQAKDKNKDQSYFLWTLTREQLKHCLFPIGDYLKSEIRKIAKKASLSTAEKKDSQGICFLGKISLDDFLKKYIPEKKGDILLIIFKDNDTYCDRKKCHQIKYKKIGEHKGAHFYTIGQRHGLGIGGSKKPYYVVEKNVKKNIVMVAEGDDNPELYKKEINLVDVNLIDSIDFRFVKNGVGILARVRYRQPLASAKFYKLNAKSYKIIFDKPQKFIAPGQSAVFYNKNGEMLGGGVIV